VGKSNYVGVFGTLEVDDAPAAGDGMFFRNSRLGMKDMLDGSSKTLVVGERHSKLGGSTWTGVLLGAKASLPRVVGVADHAPNDPHHHFDDFTSNHPAGVNFLLGDASVRRFDDSIDVEVFKALCTRAGSEPAAIPDCGRFPAGARRPVERSPLFFAPPLQPPRGCGLNLVDLFRPRGVSRDRPGQDPSSVEESSRPRSGHG
jgi:hypothetical protein